MPLLDWESIVPEKNEDLSCWSLISETGGGNSPERLSEPVVLLNYVHY